MKYILFVALPVANLISLCSCSQSPRGYPYPVNGEYIGQVIAGNPGSSNTHYGFGNNSATGNSDWHVMVQPSVGGTLHAAPAPCGNLTLGNNNTYSIGTSAQIGNYMFDAKWGTLTFTSGPMKDSPNAYQIKDGKIYIVVVVTYTNGQQQQVYFEKAVPEYAGKLFDPKTIAQENLITNYSGKIIRSTTNGTMETFNIKNRTRDELHHLEEVHINKRGDMVIVKANYAGPEVFLVNSADGNIIQRFGKISEVKYLPARKAAYPVISPDGQKIAFVRLKEGPVSATFKFTVSFEGIVVYDRNGNLLAELNGYSQPEWLTDGRLLCSGLGSAQYNFDKYAGITDKYGIYLFNASFTNAKRVDNGNNTAHNPSTNHDNLMIAYTAVDAKSGRDALYIARIDGSDAKIIAYSLPSEHLYNTAWSPDGKAVAVVENSDLYICPVDVKTNTVKVTDKNKIPLVMDIAKFMWRE
jgi:hypothetical protein